MLCHRSVTSPVIVVVVVDDAVEVVGAVVAAFSRGCSGCLGFALTILDSWFVSSSVVCRSQMYSITLWITSSLDSFRFLGISGTKERSFVK